MQRFEEAYPPLNRRSPSWPLIILALLAGCGHRADDENTLAIQVQAVRQGRSDRIHIENEAITDTELASIDDLRELRELLIDDPNSPITAQGLAQLERLENLEHLRIRGAVDDAALTEICKHKNLRILNLPRGSFSDAGLEALLQLENLQQIRLGSANVTDNGVKMLVSLPAIKQIHLIDVPITDDGLAALASIEGLESLYIDGSQFSDAALDKLFREHPKLHVHLNQQHHDRDPQQHEHGPSQ